MPKLIIDDREIEVPPGTKVITAAEQLGIFIPRFCFHPGLGAVGACRVCAVNFIDGPVKGINMSCMVDARDGMVVSTHDEKAVAFRRQVIEWLMLNHPHDCPVCDEGGHCLLQDLTIAGGHGNRRYEGSKRTYQDQYLGPLIQHEMNRCIQCYRCVRYYQEFCGYTDLGVMGIAQRIYYGRFENGNLNSPFSGNLIDLCPTGVYTDKPSRYTGRRWDFERTPGICLHCSLGCHTTVSARNRQIVRQEARFNQAINGYFICDRGRYGFDYVNLENRPRQVMIAGKQASLQEAMEQIRMKLKTIGETFGPGSIATLGSSRSSLQTLLALKYLCRQSGWTDPACFIRQETMLTVKTALSRLTKELRISMSEVEAADVIVTINSDSLTEAPMLTLALRQAQRQGAGVFALDFRELSWPLEVKQIPIHPADLPEVISQLASGTETIETLPRPTLADDLAEIGKVLAGSRRPVIVCGTNFTNPLIVSRAAELAQRLGKQGKAAGLFFVLPQANSAGAAIIDEQGQSAERIVQGIEEGLIKAMIAVETDLWEQFPNRNRLRKALEKLELRVVLDYLNTGLMANADIVIPTQTVFESGGIYVNQQCLAQTILPAFQGGLSVEITGAKSHPPRSFRKDIPGGDVLSANKIVLALLNQESDQESLESDRDFDRLLLESDPACQPLLEADSGQSTFLQMPGERLPVSEVLPASEKNDDFLVLILPKLFGSEPMSRLSSCLHELEEEPQILISQHDADRMNLTDNDRLRVKLSEESLELPVKIKRSQLDHTLCLPETNSVFWQQTDNLNRYRISRDKIEVINKG